MPDDPSTPHLRATFAKYDADGSGEIDADELRGLLKDVTGETPTPEEVESFLQDVDADGGGTVSFAEFRAIHGRATRGELQFGGLKLALDAFDELADAEDDDDDDDDASGDEEAPPARSEEAPPARSAAAEGAPSKPFFGLGPLTMLHQKDASSPPKPAPDDGAPSGCACARAWLGCLCGNTVLYSRDGLERAVGRGCPCLPPKLKLAVVYASLPCLWVWMALRLLCLPCVAASRRRAVAF